MNTIYRLGIAIAGAAAISTSALADAGHAKHNHAAHGHGTTFTAGEPGDPKKPARLVQVTMIERDGKMLFLPARIEVRKGEQVKFVLRNNGLLEHEFVLASTAENLEHAEAMKANPDMDHDDPNGKHVAPSKSGEIVWKFTKAGEFEYACLIPGHREAGMIGTVVVK